VVLVLVVPPLHCGPAADGHLQGVVGGQQGGPKGQVGHGTGAVPGGPALNGCPFVGVSICW